MCVTRGVSKVAVMRHLVLFGWRYKASSPNPLLQWEKGAKVPSLRERGFKACPVLGDESFKCAIFTSQDAIEQDTEIVSSGYGC
jgi:hypothetical protein